MGARDRSDRLIAALAAPQHGLVSRTQLLATGVTRRQIAARLDSGRLHRMHRGVYAVGHRPNTEDATWLGRRAGVRCLGDAEPPQRRRPPGAEPRRSPSRRDDVPRAAAPRHRAPPHEALAEGPHDSARHRGHLRRPDPRRPRPCPRRRRVGASGARGAVPRVVARGADPRRADAALLRAASRLPGRRRADAVGRSRIASCGCAPDIASLVLSHSRGDVRDWTSCGRSSVSSSRSTAGRRIARAWRSSRTARRRTPCNSPATSYCGSPGRTSTAARRSSRRRSAARSVSRAASPAAGSPAPPRRCRRDR